MVLQNPLFFRDQIQQNTKQKDGLTHIKKGNQQNIDLAAIKMVDFTRGDSSTFDTLLLYRVKHSKVGLFHWIAHFLLKKDHAYSGSSAKCCKDSLIFS